VSRVSASQRAPPPTPGLLLPWNDSPPPGSPDARLVEAPLALLAVLRLPLFIG
jgi:hypothetical protein